jgi:hypothetical protein
VAAWAGVNVARRLADRARARRLSRLADEAALAEADGHIGIG